VSSIKLSHRRRILDFLLKNLSQAGIFDATRMLAPNVLTVLNYHRINDPFERNFDTFKPNISATPAAFAEQMEYLRGKYNVINCDQLSAWLQGKAKLPAHAAIITFDDGYYDNFSNAYPILREKQLPAVIFLTTDFIGQKKPFYWDFVAACFFYTQRDHVELPLLGTRSWSDELSREYVMHNWIEVLKKLPENEKCTLIQNTDDILGVSIPDEVSTNLHLSWSNVREMSKSGIEFGSHTASHPILTRIPLDLVKKELEISKKRIEDEVGKQVISFAYPNGQLSDYSPEVISAVENSGYRIAFTLLSGPTRYLTVHKKPLEIRRIFISYQDSLPRFISKIAGLPRLLMN
jgi:peptidoglycan/xylan/chitin deacetylase (PgdA/CDA1 family)